MSDGSNLATALAALQAELPVIPKSERADVATKQGSYSYTYAGLASITEKLLPLLSRHGLSFIAKPVFSGERFVLAYSLLHTSGDREDGEYPLPTTGTPQAIGSAITYGRRYCLCAVTGVAPEDDDDGAAAEVEASAKRGTAKRAAPPRRQQSAPAQQPSGGQQVQRASAPAPPLPGEDSNADTITGAQLTKLAILSKELELDRDRDTYLAYLDRVVGHPVESSKQLTKSEAHDVIEAMTQDKTNLASDDTPDPAGEPVPAETQEDGQ